MKIYLKYKIILIKNVNIFFIMKFIGYKCEFNGKINEIHILINEKSNREIPGILKISRDTSRTKIEPGSRNLNPNQYEVYFRKLS